MVSFFFTVNDAVLSDNVITMMFTDLVEIINEGLPKNVQITQNELNQLLATADAPSAYSLLCRICSRFTPEQDEVFMAANEKSYDLDAYNIDEYPQLKEKSRPSSKAFDVLFNEALYYKHKKFMNAWYVDNLGSFLIVIERKRS